MDTNIDNEQNYNYENLRKAILEILLSIEAYPRLTYICIKSTTFPGTITRLLNELANRLPSSSEFVQFCSAPEYLRQATAYEDFLDSEIKVVGSPDIHARAFFKELFSPFAKEILEVENYETAESLKVFHNWTCAKNARHS